MNRAKPSPSRALRVACVCLPHVPAALEQRDDVSLVGRPLVVTAPPPHEQVVHDLSYPAHLAGVLRGMPLAAAQRICPGLVVRPARPEAWHEIFRTLLEAMGEISPEVEPADLSRGWLSTRGLLPPGAPEQSLAEATLRRVRSAVGLDARVGLAHGKLTSRILTDYLARRSVMVLPAGKEVTFLGGLSTRYLPLSPSTLAQLRRLGIARVYQYAALPPRGILPRFGYPGLRAYRLAHGHDNPRVQAWSEEPWLETEHVLPDPIANRRSLEHHVGRLAARLAAPLARQYQVAGHLRLSVSFERGPAACRSRSLVEPVAGARALAAHAEGLMQTIDWHGPVERIGLAARGLCPTAGHQLALFQHATESREGVERSLARIQARYGAAVVRQGRLLEPESPLHERRAALLPWNEIARNDIEVAAD